uniref:Holin n=1 Tax=Dulem virus 32 TaxID=3145750 RepID=A0AAU8B4C7_9CAUD
MIDTITTLATPVAVLALVELAKRLGLPTKAAAPLAVLLGVGLAIADFAWHGQAWYGAAVQGLILGLTAAGLWDIAGRAKQTTPTTMLVPLADAPTVGGASPQHADPNEPVATGPALDIPGGAL